MLQSLTIHNYALIDSLAIDFSPGFSVITGETGAGKSIILGALALLLGERADSKAIKQGAAKCVVEAEFAIGRYHLEEWFDAHELDYDAACTIRREVHANGKSRAFVNDCPINLAALKELGKQLIDIHSQHQNSLLVASDYQLWIVDLMADNGALRADYHQLYQQYKATDKQLAEARTFAARSKGDEDYLRYRLAQLDAAQLTAGEQVALEQERDLLSHTEEVKEGLYRTIAALTTDQVGTLSSLREAYQSLRKLTPLYPAVAELATRAESAYIELKDIAQEVERLSDNVAYDPARLDWINQRLDHLYTLQQNHHVDTVEALIAIADDYRTQLEAITHSDDHIAALQRERDQQHQALLALAANITATRTAAATTIAEQIEHSLITLGMPNVRFSVALTPTADPEAEGMDKVQLLFSANKNAPLQPVASIASGGEIARVMLSLKAMIAHKCDLPTLILDEIDTGVSGEIARSMAVMMRQMAKGTHRQVFSITHLPQIASLGDTHYFVYKQDNADSTSTHIRKLSTDERIAEVAHMLSGATLTAAAIANAKALLNDQ